MIEDFPSVGFGIGTALVGVIVYVAFLIFALWIGYLVIRAAVTSGIMRAAEKGAFRSMAPPPQYTSQPPMGPGPGQSGGPPFRG